MNIIRIFHTNVASFRTIEGATLPRNSADLSPAALEIAALQLRPGIEPRKSELMNGRGNRSVPGTEPNRLGGTFRQLTPKARANFPVSEVSNLQLKIRTVRRIGLRIIFCRPRESSIRHRTTSVLISSREETVSRLILVLRVGSGISYLELSFFFILSSEQSHSSKET